MNEKPIIGITVGDPAGIGPEISIKALADEQIYGICNPVLFADYSVVKYYIDLLGINASINIITKPSESKFTHGIINLIDIGEIKDIDDIEIGKISGKAGRACSAYIEKAVDMALNSQINALVTGPINKEAWKMGGVPYIGHTEMLAELTSVKDPLTMFQVNSLRIFFLTRHMSLRKACDMITQSRVSDYIERCIFMLKALGIENPRLAVAGLNPHSGEHGLFGDEEVAEIQPAVNSARQRGLNVSGPVPADSVFWACANGKYDAVLSLYHDQGHIAAKTLDFHRTVSITLGLPFIRTSVDHGTAMDIAGQGIASSISMEEAIKVASAYAKVYRQPEID